MDSLIMIDLHCHSCFSDGTLSPSDLISKAIQAKIKLLALTDHDTIAGLSSLHQAASKQPIKIINGIEFSTHWKKHDIHLIGLNFDPEIPQIKALIKKQAESRIHRAQQISERLKQYGVEDAYSKACLLAGHDRIARPHFAQLLINENKAPDMQTAFKRFLARGKPAYVSTPWISIPEAISSIKAAKGVAVIAHPLKYKFTKTKLIELIEDFKEAGGLGIEVVSGETTEAEIQELAALCSRYELFASTGSDYHDDHLSPVDLGRQAELPLNCIPIWQQWAT